MQPELNLLSRFQYSKAAWTYAKVLTIVGWLITLIMMLRTHNAQADGEGVCTFLNCGVLFGHPISYIVIAAAFMLAGLYLFEKFMPFTIFCIALIGTLVFSADKFNITHSRNNLLTLVIIAQFIAYIRYHFASNEFKSKTVVYNVAMFYSVQIVAAAYVISGISKISSSRMHWITDSPNMAVRIIRSYSSRAMDFQMPWLIDIGRSIADFLVKYPFITQAAFTAALLAELFAFVAMFGRRISWYYALLLLVLHVVILLMYGIIIPTFIVMVVAYLLNLPPKKQPLLATIAAAPQKKFIFQLLENIYVLKLPAVYIILSFILGENYPFSNFPMYSSSGTEAHYCYLTDGDSRKLSPLKILGIRTDQLRGFLAFRTMKKGIQDPFNDESIQKTAADVLRPIILAYAAKTKVAPPAVVKIYNHQITLTNGVVTEQDKLLGVIQTAESGQ